jgi:hypothetical protein
LTDEEFNTGDVAFGSENKGTLRIAFTRNNILVIVYAPTNKAFEIARGIDQNIVMAPEWIRGATQPSFIMPENHIH